jgi:hypothetical protein
LRRAATLAVLALALAAPATAAALYIPFRLPSGNIFCAYANVAGTNELRCEIVSHLRPLPPRRGPCEGVWGRAVRMAPTGPARPICISDTVQDPRSRLLRYGQTFRRGGFVCVSHRTGLTCTNRTGHGWFLSRESSRLF